MGWGAKAGYAAFVVMTSTDKVEKPAGRILPNVMITTRGAVFCPASTRGAIVAAAGPPCPIWKTLPGYRRPGVAALGGLARRNLGPSQETLSRDPEIETRISQYEMAFRMQTSVPDLVDLFRTRTRPRLSGYGPDAGKRGTFANNCLTARRLLELGGTRFVQLMHSVPWRPKRQRQLFSPNSNNNASTPTPLPPPSFKT